MSKAKIGEKAGRSKVSEKTLIPDKKVISGYKKYKLELTPKRLDLYLSKSVEAKILEFRVVGDCPTHEDYAEYVKDEDLKKLAIVINSANKIHTLNLDFSRCESKTDVGLDLICQSLRNLTSLKSLSLSFGFGYGKLLMADAGIPKLCRALKALSSLQSISINFTTCNKVTGVGICKLSQTLRTLSSLRKVEIKFYQCSQIGNAGLCGLGKVLKRLGLLQNLTLGLDGCGLLQDTGLQSLGQALKTLGLLQTIDLNFYGGKCTEAGFDTLFQGIKSLVSLKEMKLNFNGSEKITEKSVHSFGQALETLSSLQSIHLISWRSLELADVVSQIAKSLTKLSSLQNVNLDFSWCDAVAEKGMFEIGQAFKSLPNLKKITLNFGKSMTDRVVSALGKELKSVKNLQSLNLDLSQSEITDEGIEEISQTLAQLTLLKRLSLSGCPKISDTGLGHLCQCLKELFLLQDLNLDFGDLYDSITNTGIRHIGEVLKTLKSLKSFDLNVGGKEEIDDTGLHDLCQGLKTCTSLQNLDLNFTSCDQISDEGLETLAKTLKIFTELKQISFAFSKYEKVGESGIGSLAEAFKRLTRLENISIELLTCGTSVENFKGFVEAFKTLRYLKSLTFNYYVRERDFDEEIENGLETLKNLPNLKFFYFQDECP